MYIIQGGVVTNGDVSGIVTIGCANSNTSGGIGGAASEDIRNYISDGTCEAVCGCIKNNSIGRIGETIGVDTTGEALTLAA